MGRTLNFWVGSVQVEIVNLPGGRWKCCIVVGLSRFLFPRILVLCALKYVEKYLRICVCLFGLFRLAVNGFG